jgi:predicted DNA-binding ribbon-helix-helix protein
MHPVINSPRPRKSLVIKRSVKVGEFKKTTVSLEDAFWAALRGIAAAQRIPLSHLIATIDSERRHANLSSAIRLFVLAYYRSRCGSVCGSPPDDDGK